MDHSQGRVAVLYRVNDNTHGEQVVHLIQRLILVDHFFINAEEMFHAPVHLCLNVGVGHMPGNFRHDLLDKFFPLGLAGIQVFHELIVYIRLPVLQRQVVELRLDF